MTGRTVLFVAVMSSVWTSATHAQSAAEPLPGRVEVAAGAFWMGGTSFGTVDATERTSSGGSYRLFSTTSGLSGSRGVATSFGVQLSRIVQAEAAASYSTAHLQTTISDDVESGAPTISSESIAQIMLDASLLVRLERLRWGPRTLPFVAVGVGFTRDLHEGQLLLVTGRAYHAGAGVTHLFRRSESSLLKGLGVRTDVRAEIRTQGIAPNGRTGVTPSVTLSLFGRF